MSKLLSAIMTGDVDEIKALYDTSEVNKEPLDINQYCNILHEAVKLGRHKCLDKLLENKEYDITGYEETLVKTGAHTLFGDACVRNYNEQVIQVLVNRGATLISADDLQELLHPMFEFISANSKSEEAHVAEKSDLDNSKNRNNEAQVGESVKRNNETQVEEIHDLEKRSSLVRLQFILSTCRNRSLHRSILDRTSEEQINYLKHEASLKWLFCYLTYGTVDPGNRTQLALLQMQTGELDEAVITINSIMEQDELDEAFTIYHPLTKATSLITLLSYAVSENHMGIVELLVSKGADVNMFCRRLGNDSTSPKTTSYYTPFELAVEKNLTQMCEFLVESGVNVYLQSTSSAGLVLKNAIKNGNLKVIKLILMNRRFPEGVLLSYLNRLSTWQSDESKHCEIIFCLEHCLRFSLMSKATLAFVAMEKNNWDDAMEMIEEMNETDINLEILDNSPPSIVNWNLLLWSVKEDKEDFAKRLIQRGADVNMACRTAYPQEDFRVASPLCIAVENDNIRMCRLLLENGANHKVAISHGVASSWLSMFSSRNPEILKLLIQHTEDPGEIFTEYITECIDDNSGNFSQIPLVFSLDVLKIIFGDDPERFISVNSWYTLIIEASLCKDQYGIRREKQNLIKLLISYFPVVPNDLHWLISHFKYFDVRAFQLDADGDITWDLYHWLEKYSKTFPTLQRLSRYAVRTNCRSCSDDAVHSLELPSIVESYVQHPVQSDENPLYPDCAVKRMCYLEDEP